VYDIELGEPVVLSAVVPRVSVLPVIWLPFVSVTVVTPAPDGPLEFEPDWGTYAMLMPLAVVAVAANVELSIVSVYPEPSVEVALNPPVYVPHWFSTTAVAL